MTPHRHEYTVRPARGDDFEAVSSVLGKGTADDLRAVYREQVIDPRAHHSVALDAAGAVVGFCALHFRLRLGEATEEAWIAELAAANDSVADDVLPLLLEEAERRATARGCHELVLESSHRDALEHEHLRRFRMRDGGRAFRKPLTP